MVSKENLSRILQHLGKQSTWKKQENTAQRHIDDVFAISRPMQTGVGTMEGEIREQRSIEILKIFFL